MRQRENTEMGEDELGDWNMSYLTRRNFSLCCGVILIWYLKYITVGTAKFIATQLQASDAHSQGRCERVRIGRGVSKAESPSKNNLIRRLFSKVQKIY